MNSDNMVLELKQKIAQKEKVIQKASKFAPVTNCSLQFQGVTYNLHTLDKNTLHYLLVELNLLKDKSIELGYDLSFSGFSLNNWLEDLESKLANLNKNQEQNKLNKMKEQLEGLLSEDKKKELLLQQLAKELE